MKPDGVTMETTEPSEVAAEPSSTQENVSEQGPSQPEEAANNAASETNPKAGGKTVAADPKIKPKAVANKPQSKSAAASGTNVRLGAASHRTVNDVKASNSASAASAKKTTTAAAKPAAGAPVPKRPTAAVAGASSAVKNQTRVPDKRPVGQARTTSVAATTVTNGTKPTTANGTAKRRPGAEAAGVAKTKTTGESE